MNELIPFSLICERCDDGQGLDRYEALLAGWTDIKEAFDLPQANYLGLCPACQAFEDEQEAIATTPKS